MRGMARRAFLALPLVALLGGMGGGPAMACFSDAARARLADYDGSLVVAARVDDVVVHGGGSRNQRIQVWLQVLCSDPPLAEDSLSFLFRNADTGFLAPGRHYAILLGATRGEGTAYAVLDRMEAPEGEVADRARACRAAMGP